ncbi:hypothetical protein Gbem_2375 [Citrifermentans bemidjiense Bem]|uniref:Uncharacterized protein n=1 Tax=Citrifermentans bemidjiense (strain ATCC BAA-1014 / DSM 16622 / JCM 12645 / Bem) TaxID=404380 RepID=B5EF78_CITBB|nr:hypothetical protein [Citrifermentans bemidjiense]ACH39387.1 hypothetical protein Gbem_2375 [Citrifermentans bemidjiense Bem]
MKKKLAMLLAVSMFAVAAPAMAAEGHNAKIHDDQCAKECEMLLKDCGQEVDSIQDKIKKLQVMINEQGATTYTKDDLKLLNRKLQEANETLRVLNRH